MALDEFMIGKLQSIKSRYDSLTDRLGDPSVTTDQKQLIVITKERSSLEPTVEAFVEWSSLEEERVGLIEMEQAPDADPDFKELAREEIKELLVKQEKLEEEITLLLLPRDPNDDRNVMIEIRSGTGGDEAGIWAGDLVNIYKKYCVILGWKVSPVSESPAEMGGYKTCVLQITGDFVYSKMKYEVSVSYMHSAYNEGIRIVSYQ